MGRSQKALKNVATGFLNKIVLMVLAFTTRTIFIRLLGAEYIGVSSLYTNILSVLSLAEMGVGNVLIFYLYSALHKGDEEEICKLVNEFKGIYFKIIAFVFCVGIALIPFLKFIINSDFNQRDLVIYYILYLLNSVASYFVVYRTMVTKADQKEYINNICGTVFQIIMYLLQILYLYIVRDFLGYLLIQVCCTVGNNLVQNHIACRKYPYLQKGVKKIHGKGRNLYQARESIIDRKELFKNIKATFLYKVSDTIIGQTDNIIISIMFGTVSVGMYSNYYTIVAYLIGFAGIMANGLVAGFGNLNAEGNKNHTYEVFRSSMLLFAICGAFGVSCYACVIQDFIPIWIGEQYLMEPSLVIALLLLFYYCMVNNSVWMLRFSMGLFKEAQYANLIAAVINIILSVALGKLIGLSGVIFASVIARLLTTFWYESKIVFNKFGKPVSSYFKVQVKDLLSTLIILGISYSLCTLIADCSLISICHKICICMVVTIMIEILINRRSREFNELINMMQNLLRRK